MTMLQQIELRCPVCGTCFLSQAVVTTNSLVGKRTDFHECAAGLQPLPYQVHSCERCGYAGAECDFSEVAELSPFLEKHVWSELAPRVSRSLAGSEKYEAAAKVANWQGQEPQRVAELLLRAAWCCVDEGDVEAERYFRRKAAWALQDALSRWSGVTREERPVLTYLVGELWRRVGDIRQANEWFEEVEGEVVDFERHQWVIDAARQQRDRPREWFS